MDHILINGLPARAEDLAHQALVNYGAYTSFRVEGGAVAGLDRHLARLQTASEALFGRVVSEDELRRLMHLAIVERPDCWLRVSLFSPDIGHRAPSWVGQPSVMTVALPPPPPLAQSVRLQLQAYERDLPHLKHAATQPLTLARRAAQSAGYDDALFHNRKGLISEGTLWNIGLVQGDTIVWPEAAMLAGVTQSLLAERLADVGLRQESYPVAHDALADFDGAFICNAATPACPVTAIGEVQLDVDAVPLDRLHAAYQSAPRQPVVAGYNSAV